MYLSNNLRDEQNTSSIAFWDNTFSDEELKEIVRIGESLKPQEATVFNPETNESEVSTSIRKTETSFITSNNETFWIFERLNAVIQQLNNSFFKYDISGYDEIQYTKYNVGCYYHKHIDLLPNSPTGNNYIEGMRRKLSISIVLNDDYEGGNLCIYVDGSNKTIADTKKGRAIAFPSYVAHEVTEVTSGNRLSLVVWVLGAPWK